MRQERAVVCLTVKLVACGGESAFAPALSLLPPRADDDCGCVEEIEADESNGLDALELAVEKEHERHGYRDGEEADVTAKGPGFDSERRDEHHRARDDRDDEGGGAKELADGQGTRVGLHCAKSGEDIRGSVSKSEKCDTGCALVEAETGCNRAEIGAEIVACDHANPAEEEEHPDEDGDEAYEA